MSARPARVASSKRVAKPSGNRVDVPDVEHVEKSDASSGAVRNTNKDEHKQYDEAYFEKWYRSATHRVRTPAEFARQVDFVLHLAEWVLQRKVQSVLDVGCGEGQWGVALKRQRPRVQYTGVDPSAWAVAKHGKKRGLLHGGITDLDALLPARETYDLVLCVGMLNYLEPATLRLGLRQVAKRSAGVAYLELFAQGDEYEGDTDWPRPRPAAWYRTAMQSAGFVPIGMQCYVAQSEADRLSLMERG